MRVRSRPPLTLTQKVDPDPVTVAPARDEPPVEAKAEPDGGEGRPEPILPPQPQPPVQDTPAPVAKAFETPPAALSRPPAPRDRRPGPQPAAKDKPTLPYLLAALVAVLWAAAVGGAGAYIIGYENAFELTPYRIAVLALLAIGPAGLLFVMAYMARQGSQLAAEVRRARDLSEAMVAPAALASERSAEVVREIRAEIDQATGAADRARAELAALRDALEVETRRLNEAAETAARAAKALGDSLGREREEMGKLGRTLDEQSVGVVDAVERQA
ncbi:tipN, partial [Caulobacter sp. 17J65-9]|nr:tipN [Caulobacter sp. 17J65-9]